MNLPLLKSPQGEDPVIVEAQFAATSARLFKAWTTPDELKQWFGSEASRPESVSIDLQEGGSWKIVFQEKDGQTDSLSGRYLKIDPSKHLEFSWIHTVTRSDGSTEESGESIVSIEFEPHQGGSFSRLVHKAVAAQSSRSNIGEGWSGSFMKLKALVE